MQKYLSKISFPREEKVRGPLSKGETESLLEKGKERESETEKAKGQPSSSSLPKSYPPTSVHNSNSKRRGQIITQPQPSNGNSSAQYPSTNPSSTNFVSASNRTSPVVDFELSSRTQEFWGRSAVMQPSSMQGGVIHGGNAPITSNVISKTFIQRDYTEGTAVKFQEKLPEELNGKIAADSFNTIMRDINDIFGDAEKLGCRTYMEGCMGCLTAYLIFLCLESNYDKCLKRLHVYLENVNRTQLNPRGLHMMNPMERGLRVIEVLIINNR